MFRVISWYLVYFWLVLCSAQVDPDVNSTMAIINDGAGERVVSYFVSDGFVVVDGDMVYGTEDDFQNILVQDNVSLDDLPESGNGTAVGDSKRSISVFPLGTWPDNTVLYAYADSATESDFGSLVSTAMARWTSQVPCLKFDRVNLPATPDQSFVLIRKPVLDENSGGCFASVVGWSAVMYMGLGPNCGVDEITHEFGHVLGLFHEQQRPDREAYTHFVCSNLKGYPWIPNDLSKNDAVCCQSTFTCCKNSCQYKIRQDADSHGVYDLDSIMHYRRNAFSQDDALLTLTNGPDANPANPSSGDIARVMELYPCPAADITCSDNCATSAAICFDCISLFDADIFSGHRSQRSGSLLCRPLTLLLLL
jgi:Astacin (Peptidase family M12A)